VHEVETIFACAIKGGKSYLVTHSKSKVPKDLRNIDCSNGSEISAKLNELEPEERQKYSFSRVSIEETDFPSLNISVSGELKQLCD
jgi:hypothetical protein